MAGTALKKVGRKKRRLNWALNRVLKREGFNPLRELINHVYPRLEYEEKARVLIQIMQYQYSKMAPVNRIRQPKAPGVQTNVQVNVPGRESREQLPASPEDVVKLLSAAAEGNEDNGSSEEN